VCYFVEACLMWRPPVDVVRGAVYVMSAKWSSGTYVRLPQRLIRATSREQDD